MSLYHKGEFYDPGNPGAEFPGTPAPLPDSVDLQHMIQIIAGEYAAQTSVYALFEGECTRRYLLLSLQANRYAPVS